MSSGGTGRELRAELGSLLLSVVPPESEGLVLRALHLRNQLARLGANVPLFVLHDLAAALAGPIALDTLRRNARLSSTESRPIVAERVDTWAEVMGRLARTSTAVQTRTMKPDDDLLAALLLRLTAPVLDRLPPRLRRERTRVVPLDGDAISSGLLKLASCYVDSNQARNDAFLEALVRSPLKLELLFEQVDLDTVKLLGAFGGSKQLGAMGLVDMHEILGSPEANDVVNFSLDLLPSVLETKRASSRQTFSIDGYAGIERKGTLDSLMLSELAFDEDLFDQRFLENELFYYARERANEHEGVLHYICIDASASMRGKRSAFARGLAIALAKKLSLLGEDVLFRFFDARLYEAIRERERGLDVPYLLSFRGEHGRNYTHVFELLAEDVARRTKRDGASPIVYLITHAECHAPVELVEKLAASCKLYGIFMLPSSGTLDLDYLPLLERAQVVDESMLHERKARAARALDIVDDVVKTQASSRGELR